MKVKLTFAMLAVLLAGATNLVAQPKPGTPLWVYDAGQTISSTLALAPDGTVYVGVGWSLYAITNAGSSASNQWTFTMDGPELCSSAVTSDGTIYAGAGHLYAVNPDGSQKWRSDAGAGNGSPAIALDGTVYFHGGYALLYAFSPSGTLM